MATKFNDLFNEILKENIPTQTDPNQQAALNKAQQEIDNIFKAHGSTTDPNAKLEFNNAITNNLDAYVKETQKQQATTQPKANVPPNSNQQQNGQQQNGQQQNGQQQNGQQQNGQQQNGRQQGVQQNQTQPNTPPKFPIK